LSSGDAGCEVEVGAEESGSDFSDEFFHGIAFVAPLLAAEIAVEALGLFGPVDGFMREGRIIGFGVPEAFERRHLYEIMGRE